MAKRVAGVTEKLMEAAKQEFLKNGYERASLQTIAEKAGSSKGAIYIRYPDKESLYRSLVQPAMDDFCGMIQSALQQFNQLPGTEQTSQMYSFSDQWFWASVDYIYDHFDEFKLLLTSGENNTYQEFLHRIVELDNQCTMRYLLSFAYFFPADIENRILFQHDTAAGAGAGQEVKEYYEQTGERSRWTNSLFGDCRCRYACRFCPLFESGEGGGRLYFGFRPFRALSGEWRSR